VSSPPIPEISNATDSTLQQLSMEPSTPTNGLAVVEKSQRGSTLMTRGTYLGEFPTYSRDLGRD